jgi:diphosphomevalonate decarboxylase
MLSNTAIAVAHPNIALIKYWGNRDHELRLPANGSISMTLGKLETQTTVIFDNSLNEDSLVINNTSLSGPPLERLSSHLDFIRQLAGISAKAEVRSQSNFPRGAGIASSASGFAALTVAATAAAGLDLDLYALSRISRRGSGSACRSIFGGFVEWKVGTQDDDSFAEPLVDMAHWDLWDIIAIVDEEHKAVGSTTGHLLAETSPLQKARVKDTERRLNICKQAIHDKDFSSLASIVEEDSNLMHAVMMTSQPQLYYWQPETIVLMRSVQEWRKDGMEVCFTIDAGPNIHCLCTSRFQEEISTHILQIPGVRRIIKAPVGGPAHLINPKVEF